MNIWAILLGTIGGFSSLFGLLVSPMIRGYNRISIYIAFFSFFMVCILLNQLKQYLSQKKRLSGFYFCLALVLVFGITDQVPSSVYPIAKTLVPQFEQSKRWVNDENFFRKVEASMPKNSAIMQFPHMTFPECAWVHGVPTYDNIRGYLHTSHLRWSYPMRGRHVDRVLSKVSAEPIVEQVRDLAVSGFTGISIDRRGYPDNAVAMEEALSSSLNQKPIVSDDGTMSFFSMVNYVKTLHDSMTASEWESARALLWEHPDVQFGAGFHGLEVHGSESWRWSQNESEFVLDNPTTKPMQVEMRFVCLTGQPTDSIVSIKSPILSIDLTTSNKGVSFVKTFVLPPGLHTIHFFTNTPSFKVDPDPREFVFMVRNFQLSLVDAKTNSSAP